MIWDEMSLWSLKVRSAKTAMQYRGYFKKIKPNNKFSIEIIFEGPSTTLRENIIQPLGELKKDKLG